MCAKVSPCVSYLAFQQVRVQCLACKVSLPSKITISFLLMLFSSLTSDFVSNQGVYLIDQKFSFVRLLLAKSCSEGNVDLFNSIAAHFNRYKMIYLCDTAGVATKPMS